MVVWFATDRLAGHHTKECRRSSDGDGRAEVEKEEAAVTGQEEEGTKKLVMLLDEKERKKQTIDGDGRKEEVMLIK